MRKKKERAEKRSETLVSNTEGRTEEINKDEEGEGKGFFACYLLCSLCPRFKGHTYIGFTVNPCRRIRQHNGEITCGAWRTKRKRPWEMVLCIYGFPTNVSALQFEWAWQHPRESLAVRKAAATFKSLSGIAGRVKLAYTMLTLPPWQSLKLTVNFFSTKYTKNSAGCPSLPKQMKVQVCAMDELPCYIEGGQISDENEDDEELENDDDEIGNCDKGLSGNLMDISVGTTVEHQDTDHDWERWIEDGCTRQRSDPPSPREEDNGCPFRLVDSPLLPLSARIANLVNTRRTVEDRDPFGLIEETGNKLGSETNQLLTSVTAASCNQSSIDDSLLYSHEVGFRQPREFLSPRVDEDRLPFREAECLVETQASSSGLADIVQAVEDRDFFGLMEESGKKLGRQTKELATTITSVSDSQSPSKNSLFYPLEKTDNQLARATKELTTTITSVRDNQSPSKNSLLCPFEVDFRQPIDLLHRRKEDCRLPYCLVDSPVGTPSSSITAMADIVAAVQDRVPFGLVEESSNNLERPNKQQLRTPTTVNNDRPPSSSNNFHPSSEVEVINLSTPSSDCIIRSCHRKKRAPLTHRDIIDLTKSPLFVQL